MRLLSYFLRPFSFLNSYLRPSDKLVVLIILLMILVSGSSISYAAYLNSTTSSPVHGGAINIGMVGAPRFINPVLDSISQTDKNMTNLIYSGLMTRDENGKLIPEIASRYTISPNKKEYIFYLKKDIVFHDGTSLTADDVIFTIKKITQPNIKSPLRQNWDGVTVIKVNDYTIKFILPKPYTYFLQNTTIGILPKAHWQDLTDDEFIFSKLNTTPIGTGPYKFDTAVHTSSGILESMALKSFDDYVLGEAYIDTLNIHFYTDEDELTKMFGQHDLSSVDGLTASKISKIQESYTDQKLATATLPRLFAIFFNTQHQYFDKKEIRTLLRDVIDTKHIANNILKKQAISVQTPFILKTDELKRISSIEKTFTRANKLLPLTAVQDTLKKIGWQKNNKGQLTKNTKQFTIKLATMDSYDLKLISTYIAKTWRKLGINVIVTTYKKDDIANVIRTRDYDVLLFGEFIGYEPDLYVFWHSSQKTYPGLNISNYTDKILDNLLLSMRVEDDKQRRTSLFIKIIERFKTEAPAFFLYSPTYSYLMKSNIYKPTLPEIMEPEDHFNSIHKWYTNTKRVLNTKQTITK